ncbi:hypothetical protein M408DRAFT_148936 [Serendipita vermifera MAFF 305830]|uniref:Uncharacterized protein n=1 Tax=Serendipita vermifera MAFF 305830 TaxID=933852 RepID=A0A0C3B8I7_SERVB|nr:hypothetical protein M408DRAFT_197694 [Serendipita vermifera MAFF 305830]KIM33110.1 hypothetical protein M408DRAFT_148936 [Serendipita vermifera MAFF 305830]
MNWAKLQIQPGSFNNVKRPSVSSAGSRSSGSGASYADLSNNGSSQTSAYSDEVLQASRPVPQPKWALTATYRIRSIGKNLRRSFGRAPKGMTQPISHTSESETVSSEQQHQQGYGIGVMDVSIENNQGCEELTTTTIEELGHCSPTPTWTTADDLAQHHIRFETEQTVPLFSGWAAFCGTYAPPTVVSRTHWDDKITLQNRNRLQE